MVKFFTITIITLLGLIPSSFGITSNDITGTWTDSNIGSITFYEDGNFSMTNMPYIVDKSDGSQRKPMSEDGTWKLNPNNTIEMRIKPSETLKTGFYNELITYNSTSFFNHDFEQSLFVWIGEPGEERYELKKIE